MKNALFEYLKNSDVEYKSNVKLSKLSSIKIGGVAETIVYPSNENELTELVLFLTDNEIQYKILGRMTNVLFSDLGFSGVIISSARLVNTSVSGKMLFAECGVHLSQEIKKLANLGLRLSDELYGIPASFGGAVYNNAGAYGKDISESFVYARLFSPEKRKVFILDRSDMAFSYRKSILQKENLIFLGGEFLVSEAPTQEILDRLNSIFKKRLETQPYEMPSLGSIFKRNDFAPVSKLIDELGLKGTRVGDAEISQKHAGFIVNRGCATAEDVKGLISVIKEKIYRKYGFYPEEEIEYL